MKIAVIGAGTMGSGIAWVFAASGFQVLLCDVSMELALKGKAQIEKGISKQITKGTMNEKSKNEILCNLQVSTIPDIGKCDFLIEAIKEDAEIKKSCLKSVASSAGPM